ncbi:ABC transporter ATP-binding protein [Mesobacillus foraminis]|uniref:ABC transporter ATP-binding protein n=1 Tax=Mesobacillus foraminis TaxID=279826 RepID=UPI0039A3836B
MKHVWHFIKEIHNFSGKTLYFNLTGMVLVSLFEGVGIFLLIPMIGLAGMMEIDSGSIPYVSSITQLFGNMPQMASLAVILGIYVLIMICQSVFYQSQVVQSAKIQQGFVRHLREKTYQALIHSNWNLYLNKRKSDIINSMTNELGRVSGGTQLFLQFITSLVFTFIQIVLAFWLSVKMTLFVLLFGSALIFLNRKFINKSNTLGNETLHLSKTYLATITDNFNGMKDIKSNTLEDYHLSWFRILSSNIEKNAIKFVKVRTISQLIYKAASAILIAVFVFLSIKLFQAQPAHLVLILVIFSRLWPRFAGIQSNLEQIGATIPSFISIIDLQKDCANSRELNEGDFYNIEPLKIHNEIELKNIFFRYNQDQPSYALQNIDLKIPMNKMTAIVGPSGAGKSTLVDLLMGLNKAESGEILLDGVNLSNDNILSLRRSISYVAQDPFLFNASIRENLQIMSQNVSDEQIWDALEFSAAADFVRNLSNGLDTRIGDRGIKLSGGERQRLVLARAILRKPSILVLDEATSALDSENEAIVQGALDRLKGEMTIIIIAHRLSTIRNADQVIVLEQGKVIQSGGYSQLASDKRGVFSSLLQKQMDAIS